MPQEALSQHGEVEGQLQAARKRIGRTASGTVFEQPLVVTLETGSLTLRRMG
jgi:hypothetical protein